MNRSLLVLTLAVVPTSLVFGTGCKKVVPPVPEAGVIVIDASAAVDPDAGAAVADALDAAVAPLATTAAPVHTAVATGGPYQGSYKCFGNMTVTQTGKTVSARLFPGDSKNYSVLVCTAADNDCEGKVTAYTQGKAGEVRTASLKRNDKGDLVYRGQNETQPTQCRKQ